MDPSNLENIAVQRERLSERTRTYRNISFRIFAMRQSGLHEYTKVERRQK